MDTPPVFASLPLPPALLRGVEALGYTAMTPVQAQALPPILEGRDLIAQAPTGSGKTAAFGLGLLQRLDATAVQTQALVLCPTRELAEQVGDQLRRLATGVPNVKLTVLCGGIPLAPQLASLTHAPHVVVGTPGRILELIGQGALKLGEVQTFVLDEADRMLDMGFEDQIRDIARHVPAGCQRLLFSATFPDAIRALAKATLRDPAEVSVQGAANAPAIKQVVVEADPSRKAPLLAALLLEHRPESCLVFCNMRRDVDEVAASLAHYGFDALALHGDMEQRDRAQTLLQFANRSCNVLVASDVAARGLDIDELSAVVNYDVPSDPDTYMHRIGRTGRAGRDGLALTLCTPQELRRMDAIEEHQSRTLPRQRAQPVAGKPKTVPRAAMATLRIDAGKSDKLRPGDILGALTGDAGLPATAIGKIVVQARHSYVAIARHQAPQALARLRDGKIKGRRFRVAAL